MRRKVALVLVVTGVLVAMYPLFTRVYTWYWQQRYLAAWDEVKEEYHSLSATLAQGEDGETGAGGEQETEEKELPLLGVLTIKKIDARLPILTDSSAASLRRGAGHIPGTALPGGVGNCLLTAHRSHTYGRNFNRLDEVEVGDAMVIDTGGEEFTYRVTAVFIVEPDDLSVLAYEEGEELLTLVTCHPLYVASHRLIVRGVRAHGCHT